MGDAFSEILDQSVSTYTLKSIRRADGSPLVVGIQRIALLDLAVEGAIPYDELVSAGAGQSVDRARQKALERVKPAAKATQVADSIRASIRIIDLGCPELRGRVFATNAECPRDEAGRRTALLFNDLGDDFADLVEAISVLSTRNLKEASEKARSFSEQQGAGAGAGPGVPEVRGEAEPVASDPAVESGGPGL